MLKNRGKQMAGLLLMLALLAVQIGCGKQGAPAESQAAAQTTEKSETQAANQAETTETKNDIDYPTQDIRVIVAFSTGGQTDLISRKIAEIIQKKSLLNASVITVNMPGGNTADAAEALCDADPDGYTFYMHHTGMITNHVMGTLNVGYSDMKLCGGIVDQGFAIVARADDDRFSNGEELVEYLKAHPGELSVAFPGYASAGHFALLSFLKSTDLLGSVVEVPYGGGAEAISAHLSGETDLRATNMGDSARYVASGDIKYLCMISREKNKMYPEIQTLADLGSEDMGFQLHTAIFAPKDTPDEITEKFMSAVRTACEDEEFAEFLSNNGLSLAITDADEIKAIYDQDNQSILDMSKLLSEK